MTTTVPHEAGVPLEWPTAQKETNDDYTLSIAVFQFTVPADSPPRASGSFNVVGTGPHGYDSIYTAILSESFGGPAMAGKATTQRDVHAPRITFSVTNPNPSYAYPVLQPGQEYFVCVTVMKGDEGTAPPTALTNIQLIVNK